MTLVELIERFRRDADDLANPPLWDEDDILANIASAQDEFCRLTGGLRDSTSSITQIAVAPSNVFVSHSSRIMTIRAAKRLSDHAEIRVLNIANLPLHVRPPDYGISREVRLDATTGELFAVVVGIEEKKLRLVEIPIVSDTIALTVDRLPLVRPTDVNTHSLEIDEEFHLDLLDWVKYLAYNVDDSEINDPDKAERHRGTFEKRCASIRLRRDALKHRHRVVAYGGL